MGSRRLCVALAAALALVASGPAMADEDGGTRSPFARGAGGRGAGMGGAFVGLADDASALVWNPGGLARVSRFNFEVGHARFQMAETGEQFLALAIPSWRWGVGGLTLRHLGFDGIEGRDANNNPIPGSITSAETEIAFGYGRALSPGFGVGAAIKLQRQELAGLVGSGLGADVGIRIEPADLLGARAPWAAPFSVGLAVRNIIEPAIRLDRDLVPDPSVLRAGLAWRYAGLVLSSDIEHSTGMTPRVHAGAELNLGTVGALRTGLDDGRLSVGTSLRWQGLSIDYVHEERELGSVERVGLTKSLGPTMVESRDAARAAEERELSARLERDFEDRQREQIASLLRRAESDRTEGRLDDALEAVAAVRALAPGDPRANALEAAVLCAEGARLEAAGDFVGAAIAYDRAFEASPSDSVASAGRKRAHAKLDHRASVTRELDAAYGAFAAGNLGAARQILLKLREASPNDSAAAGMLRRVEEALAQRIALRLERVRRDLDAGLLEEAERELGEARGLGASEAQLGALKEALAQAMRRAGQNRAPERRPGVEREGKAAEPPSRPPEAQRREAESLYRRGLASAAAGQADGAVRFWELAIAIDAGHRGAREALKRQYLLRGMEAFGRGRFDEAERLWSRVLELDPADARARGYRERARTQIERTRELTRRAR